MLSSRGKLLKWLIVVAACLAVLPLNVYAAATGKVKGTLIDAETKEPVIGASVFIVGTRLGAQSDLDGNYMIYQVEPGSYTIKISHIEYKTVEVLDVMVKADLTTEISRDLEKKVSELDETITVRGEVDIIDRFEVSNQISITKEVIERQPVTTVDELLTQVAGVVTNTSGEVFIRGGRAGEISYIVDGVPIGDPLGGLGQAAGANLSLVSGSIQEFTVIKDGFDPEYGDALSGIVKITTQTGSKDNTNLNIHFLTDDFGNEALNKYSRNNDYLRVTLKGPDPIFKSKILPALGINFLEDKEFTYFLYGEIDKSDGVYQYERYDTPSTVRPTGSFNLFGLDIPDRRINKYYWMANFKFRPKQNLKFIVSYKESKTLATVFDWDYRYSAITAPVQEVTWNSLSLEVSQSVTKRMNYELVLSYTENGLTQKPGDPNRPGHGLEPDDFLFDYQWEDFEDRNGNGVYDPPEPIINLFPDTAVYGDNFTGPGYTFGETGLFEVVVQQGGGFDSSTFRFNDNGIIDSLEGEPFIDLNGNGIWDAGDYLHDKNGNGLLDDYRLSRINQRNPEPYIDGDSVIGEPFVDINGNNIYDAGIDIFIKSVGPDNMDYNYNGRYDGPNDFWSIGTPYVDRNGNGIYDAPNFEYDQGEPFIDVNGNGAWDGGGTSTFFDPVSYDEDATWHDRITKTVRGELKLFWQLGNHELKGGVAVHRDDFNYQEIEKPYILYTGRSDSGTYANRGAFRDMFSYSPWGGTVYLRDKIEYGSMIASLGFRWDFFIQDKWDLVDVAKADDLGSGIIYGDRQKFSPRIGFSYPISDKAKVHFNYGHFFQLPSLRWMYARNTVAVNENTIVGNYNLDYQKTIQYSFGVKYAMSENYSVDISGYFKDEFDKINAKSVRVGGLTRQQYRNGDYGRSRGFELQLEKRGGGYVNGMVSYTYAFAFGKASQTNENYMSDFQLSREPLSEAALDNDVRHSLKSNIQIFIPSTVKPRLFGLPIPNGWSLAIETFIESGRPFTPDRSYPNISASTGEDIQTNSLRKPAIVTFDVRLTKDFKLAGLDYSFILWVENVFDSRNVVEVYENTGRPDTQQNQSQVIKGGTPYDLDPENWDYGRQIRVGVEVNI
ncbi:MAG: TonB-dependent receptor [candidate division Zixibacteria bacterium]|nr:TonB-dependent receptor [candidate division Zixibacteria bacterium]